MFSFEPLSTLEEARAALERSAIIPLLVFKHSSTCGISNRALREAQDFLARCETPLEARLLVVQEARAVSNFLAERLSVEHQTPQALLVADGAVLWCDSHSRLRADRIAAAIEQALAQTSTSNAAVLSE